MKWLAIVPLCATIGGCNLDAPTDAYRADAVASAQTHSAAADAEMAQIRADIAKRAAEIDVYDAQMKAQYEPEMNALIARYRADADAHVALSPVVAGARADAIEAAKKATAPDTRPPDARAAAMNARALANFADSMFQTDKERAERAKLPGVKIGMTPAQALGTSWGKPDHINRTTTAGGISEQWVYGGNNYLYFRDGKLVAIEN